MKVLDMGSPELGREEFEVISRVVRQVAGIHLHEGKQGLVRTRLSPRLRALGLADYGGYLAYLRSPDGEAEMPRMLEALTTNKTSFFREPGHFRFLSEELVPAWEREGSEEVRLWSAGCSSGEEPYTIALLLGARAPALKVRILATDLSQRMLERARAGVYREEAIAEIPETLRRLGLEPGPMTGTRRIRKEIADRVRFARLNLMDPWPMKGRFDAIFCRNVMIYFDRPTQERLVNRFADVLVPGGHLFIGHAESLTGIRHPLRYVLPAIYRRPD